jgi:hypothetical protein
MVSEEIEEKINEVQQEQQHKRKEKLWKIIGIIFTVFAAIILIVWAANSENFKLFPFLGSIFAVVVIFVGLFFGVGWWRKYQELKDGKLFEGKLPPAINIEQAAEMIEIQLKNPRYADYVTGWKQHRTYNVGKGTKSRVLVVQLDTIYNTSPYQFYIMNLHYPREMWSYICQDKYNINEITRCVNSLAVNPDDEPHTTVIEEENALTGTRRKVTETHKQEDKQKEENKKGDLE